MSRILIHSLYEDQSPIAVSAFLCCYVGYNLPHLHLLMPLNAAILLATARWKYFLFYTAGDDGEVRPLQFVSKVCLCASLCLLESTSVANKGKGKHVLVGLLPKHRSELRKISSLWLSAKAVKQINPSETCCFKWSTTHGAESVCVGLQGPPTEIPERWVHCP